jgi:hypothetical protein
MEPQNDNLTEKELREFKIKIIEGFAELEKGIEEGIVYFFKEYDPYNVLSSEERKGQRENMYANIKSRDVELFWKNFIFNTIEMNFGFKQKWESYKFLFSLNDWRYFQKIKKSKPSYFIMIDQICSLRNLVAHTATHKIKDSYISMRQKAPKLQERESILPRKEGEKKRIYYAYVINNNIFHYSKKVCKEMEDQLLLATMFIEFNNGLWSYGKKFYLTPPKINTEYFYKQTTFLEEKIKEQEKKGVFDFFLSDEERKNQERSKEKENKKG